MPTVVYSTGGAGSTLSATLTSDANSYVVLLVEAYNAEVTAATWNGTSMTALTSNLVTAGAGNGKMFGLLAPESGTHDFVVTGGTAPSISIVQLKDVNQSTPYNTITTNARSPGAPTITSTNSATGELVINGVVSRQGENLTPTTSGLTRDQLNGDPTYGNHTALAHIDGASSVTCTWTGDQVPANCYNYSIFVSFKPYVASGPANVKTWNGLAQASVKTSNGLAIASVKKRNGLA